MILILILVPLVAASLATVWPASGRLLAALATLVCAGIAVRLAFAVYRAGIHVHELGGWVAPLGIRLTVDGLSSVMLLMTAFVALPVVVYAAGYYRREEDRWTPADGFWPLALLLLGGLNALFSSGDLFNLYVTIEIVTLSAVGLVILSGGEKSLVSGIRYLLAGFVGSILYLLGVGLVYGAYGALDLEALTAVVGPQPPAILAAALVTVALILKTALFPLHFWLPRAHAAAPAPVSALLSSLVVTAAFYLLLRLWTGPFLVVLTPSAAQVVGILGTGAVLWGSLQAVRQQHLKVMVAYSTVAQIGYLAGTIVHALGGDRIVGISGIARQLPVTTYAFGIAGMTLIGLPPSGGFVAKWMLLTAAFASGQWWWAMVMLVGGILTAGYVFLVLGQELSLAESDHEVRLRPVPKAMEYAAMALALAALVLGVRVTEPLALLRVGMPAVGGG